MNLFTTHFATDTPRQGRPAPASPAELLGVEDRLQPIHEQVEAGLPYAAFERLQGHLDLSAEDTAEVVGISPRTLARRRDAGRLTLDESDRVVRIARLLVAALGLFEGDAAAARHWLRSAAPGLGGETPLGIARTEVGAREAEHLVGRLEHGVFS